MPGSGKRLRPSIKFDPMTAKDYLKYDFRFACEDCSHFSSDSKLCTIGYHTKWHLKDFQKKSFELGGKMALCRFIEID